MARLNTIRVGDIVLVDVKGRRTYAVVTAKDERELRIRPINDKGFGWRTVTSRQVVEHYRKTKNIRQSESLANDKQPTEVGK